MVQQAIPNLTNSKQEIVDAIVTLAELSGSYKLSRGSSVPAALFVDLENAYLIPVAHGMEGKAATFCDYYGIEWTDYCDSSISPSGGGGTVTKFGLLQLYKAVLRANSLAED
ncbi:MAG: hypothetical protein Q8K86_04290 [Candidatus Nanopelagicaceae bacterium]|nr:hypothetical protein [Candidatus Nanopelagicaceae bacterium]